MIMADWFLGDIYHSVQIDYLHFIQTLLFTGKLHVAVQFIKRFIHPINPSIAKKSFTCGDDN